MTYHLQIISVPTGYPKVGEGRYFSEIDPTFDTDEPIFVENQNGAATLSLMQGIFTRIGMAKDIGLETRLVRAA